MTKRIKISDTLRVVLDVRVLHVRPSRSFASEAWYALPAWLVAGAATVAVCVGGCL